MVELMQAMAVTAFIDDDVLEDDMSEPNWAEMLASNMWGSPLRLIASQSMHNLTGEHQLPHQMRLAA